MAVGADIQNNFGKVIPVFTVDFDHAVWKLRFDEISGWVAVECRNPDTLENFFSVFSATHGAMVLTSFKPANAWWTGLADMRDGIMYLQGITAKGAGRPMGITAVSVVDGQILWQRPEYSFYALSEATLLVLPPDTEKTNLINLNPRTGEEIETGTSLEQVQEKTTMERAPGLQGVKAPHHYPEENRYFADLQKFIKEKTNCIAQFAIDYLEHRNTLVLGFYPRMPENQRLYRVAVFSRAGEFLFAEDLGKDLSGIGTDNFFIFQDTLILLKNKKSLSGYAV